MPVQSLELVVDDLMYVSFPTPCLDASATGAAASLLSGLDKCDSTTRGTADFPGEEAFPPSTSSADSSEEEITMFNIVVATVRPSALSRELAARNLLSDPSPALVSGQQEGRHAAAHYWHSARRERDFPGNDPVSVLLGIRNNEATEPYTLATPIICK